MHKQTWARVNAPVDEEIKELVEALSSFPKLQTIESCQGDEQTGAWVCFWYGEYWENSWNELAAFVLRYLGPKLMAELGDRVSISIRVNTAGLPLGELTIRPGAITRTARLLRELAA